MLNSHHNRNQTRLRIARSSTPDVSPVVFPRVRRLIPLGECGGEDGDDVLVRGQEEGFEGLVGAMEFVDEGPVTDRTSEVLVSVSGEY